MDSNDIKQMQFTKSAMFGYKPNEVDDYLSEVSAEFEDLTKKNADLREKLEILARKVRQYRANEEQLKDSILNAQAHANEIVSEATEKSEKMINDAKAESERILDEAKLKSVSMLNDAKTEYDKILEATDAEQKGSKLALTNLQQEVSVFKANLVELYKEHLAKVIAMPETVEDAVDIKAANDSQLSLEDNISDNKIGE